MPSSGSFPDPASAGGYPANSFALLPVCHPRYTWVGSLCATIGLRIPFFDGVGLELHHLVTHTAEFLP